MNQNSLNSLRIPAVTTEQMMEVDTLMVEKFGVEIIQMMENAGRNLAELVRRRFGGSVVGKHIVIAAGRGNNGGGGLVASRHFYNWGARITLLMQSETLGGVPEKQWLILKKLPVEKRIGDEAISFLSSSPGDLIIDSLIGYGLSGKPRGWIAKIINAINLIKTTVVALDVPSGLDATTGEIYDPCIEASATMTLALPKVGLLKPESKKIVGSLYLADIGVPDVLYKEMGIGVGKIFSNNEIIDIDLDIYRGGKFNEKA